MILKTRAELLGEHVHIDIFSAPRQGQTFANLGHLIMRVGEAQLFLTALLMGSKSMKNHLVVEHEGHLSEKAHDAHS